MESILNCFELKQKNDWDRKGAANMLNNEIVTKLNEQLNKELYSTYFYLDMSNYYFHQNLDGFGNWFYVQAQEERDHAMLFNKYLLNNDQKVVLTDVKASGVSFSDFREPLSKTLEHERFITASINDIYAVAYTQKDFRTMQFLDWFVKEQGEEEKNADDLVKKFDLFGKDSRGLYLLDTELKARVYTPATLVL